MTGRLTVLGVGPGRVDWCTPSASARLTTATDLVGYGPYLDLVAVDCGARRHPSDNRVEADRACHALDLAEAGGDVVVVSSGDPGVFAMASAVLEQLDLHPERWPNVDVDVEPGITAAQAVASRVGAPLGHDFCVISLSDVLKPWAVIERRLDAAAAADFVIALYNPRSRHRPHQLAQAIEVVGRHRQPSTPVIIGRSVGRPGESVTVTDLARLMPDTIDMSTVIVIGSSTTRVIDRPLGSSVYTPRAYGIAEADEMAGHATEARQ
jgi:precorrin-2 C20-methyltransferase/precorrin-3B C17-methyltransferase